MLKFNENLERESTMFCGEEILGYMAYVEGYKMTGVLVAHSPGQYLVACSKAEFAEKLTSKELRDICFDIRLQVSRVEDIKLIAPVEVLDDETMFYIWVPSIFLEYFPQDEEGKFLNSIYQELSVSEEV